jgi:pimeloyl-ACP methyl ester carboxylesterase
MTITATAASDLFRAPPSQHLDVGHGAVAHRQVGSGPDVLFVHGWPVSGATFRTLLPHLADHVTCHVIDLPGTGSSRFESPTPIGVDNHITAVTRTIDALGLDDVALVGHDSGGLIARHAGVDDARVRAFGLIDTEHLPPLTWRFRSFLAARHLPGFGAGLGQVAGARRLRRNQLALGGAFADRSLLDGEFDELFLRPLHDSPELRGAAVRILKSFRARHLDELEAIHRRIAVPVQLVWGEHDIFFPPDRARAMVDSFADARLEVVRGAGLFSHEERPAEVAAALLPTLLGQR